MIILKRIANLLNCLLFVSIFLITSSNVVTAAELNWVWFYSDDCYGEHISPESIKVIRDYNNNVEHIEAWTKTIYDEEGKNEVINNYWIKQYS